MGHESVGLGNRVGTCSCLGIIVVAVVTDARGGGSSGPSGVEWQLPGIKMGELWMCKVVLGKYPKRLTTYNPNLDVLDLRCDLNLLQVAAQLQKCNTVGHPHIRMPPHHFPVPPRFQSENHFQSRLLGRTDMAQSHFLSFNLVSLQSIFASPSIAFVSTLILLSSGFCLQSSSFPLMPPL